MKGRLGLGAYIGKALAAELHGGKTLFLLTVAGVALGVAAVIGIQILNRNALAAFSGGVEAVSDRADLTVTSLTPELSEALYPRVLGTAGVAAAWPLTRLDVCLAADPTVFLEVIGLDVFAPMGLALGEAAAATESGSGEALVAALTEPGWVALSPAFAAERGWQVGDTLAVTSGSRRVRLTVGALLDYQRQAPLATRKLAFMDIAQAQALFGGAGRLDEIGVRLAAGAQPAQVAAALAARLGPGVEILDAGGRRREAAGLLAAFRLNLTALSLISLVVGLFLIYSSVQAALVRRRAEFGLLRALGATAPQVLAIILAEAALLGAFGTALGLPLGWWVAKQGVATVSATLTNIYLLSEIERLTLPASLI
ncbi:FtsX-like permease family protein, partial [bacterium]|nr:FtsX-like permease family protein [bacterium]